jgi:endonuclease/exonuclease/phosphatase family metal-dependent hydrolase
MSVTFFCANLKEGVGTDSVYSPAKQVAILGASPVDIVGCSEFPVNNITHYNDQFNPVGFTLAVSLANDPGRSDGNAIWTRNSTVTVHQTYTKALVTGVNPHSGLDGIGLDGTSVVRKTAVAIRCTVGGLQFYTVSTHLAWSQGRNAPSGAAWDNNVSDQRENQIDDLLSWETSTLTGGHPILLMGDLNFKPDDLTAVSGLQHDLFTSVGYTDLWQEGLADAKATADWGDRDGDAIPDMPLGDLTTRTLDSRRIDYFFLKGSGLTLNAIDVPDLRETCSVALTTGGAFKQCPDVISPLVDFPEDQGVRPSDHNWITTTLDIESVDSPAASITGKVVMAGKIVI